MNILIVDDEIDQREILRNGLKNLGYEVREATSAEEGLNILHSRDSKINLVLTDYRMGGMNGLQFLQAIRQCCGKLPVIMMSGYIERNTLDIIFEHGCNCFLEKPFAIELLTAELERVLRYHAAPAHRDNDSFEDTATKTQLRKGKEEKIMSRKSIADEHRRTFSEKDITGPEVGIVFPYRCE